MSNTRNRVIYAGNTVLISDPPSWNNQTGKYDLKLLKRIQSSSISINSPIERSKQVGSTDYVFEKYIKNPTVKVDLNYLLTDNSNELLLNLKATGDYSFLKNLTGSPSDQNLFFVYSENNEDVNFLTNYTGLDVVGIGNAFITNYSIGAAVGGFPNASVSFDALNVTYQNYTGFSNVGLDLLQGTQLPAINLTGGIKSTGSYYIGTGNFDTSNYLTKQNLKPNALKPGDIVLQLQQPVLGGVKFSGDITANISSFQIDIPITRKDLVGFGSNYPYDKRLILPTVGSLSFEGLFNDFKTGDYKNIFDSNENYQMTFILKDADLNDQFRIYISNAKLEQSSYNLNIGDNMSFSTDFSFKVTDTDGFIISGKSEKLDTQAVAYFESANITNESTKIAVNHFVNTLKENNLWNKMSGIYPFIGASANSHKYNLKNPSDSDSAFRLSFNGANTVHSTSGVEFLGTNDYANTFFNPNINLSGNPVHISILNLQDASNVGDSPDAGCQAQYGLPRLMMYLEADNTVAFDVYDYSTNRISISNPNSQAFYVGTRESDSIGHLLLFRNSINPIQSEKNITMTSTTKPNYNMYIGGINNFGTVSATSTSNRRFGFLSFGDGLTSGESVKLYSAVKQLQFDLNRNTEIFV